MLTKKLQKKQEWITLKPLHLVGFLLKDFSVSLGFKSCLLKSLFKGLNPPLDFWLACPTTLQLINLLFIRILQLYTLPLVNSLFNLLDKVILLLSQLLQSELHDMDLLLTFFDLRLAKVWINCLLHFFFKLDLSFPEKDLRKLVNT